MKIITLEARCNTIETIAKLYKLVISPGAFFQVSHQDLNAK